MTRYESIGGSYSQTRNPDARLTRRIIELLDLPAGSTVADIGAGTGNYSRELHHAGYHMVCVEPSSVMRAQAPLQPQLRWIDASAESIPLHDSSVDGAIAILSCHHFSDHEKALREIDRISGAGPILLFTVSPEPLAGFWLCEYFPWLLEEASAAFPPVRDLMRDITRWTGRAVRDFPFPLPPDLRDRFAASGWAKPETYLNPDVRRGISSFVRMPEDALRAGLERLEYDLDSGKWTAAHGRILGQSEYDAGYRFLKLEAGPRRNEAA